MSSITVEVDIDEFSDDELLEECRERDLLPATPKVEVDEFALSKAKQYLKHKKPADTFYWLEQALGNQLDGLSNLFMEEAK